MPYKSNLPQITERMRRARAMGLIAAAEPVITKVKEGLRGGYTSGDFVTGQSVAAVNRSEPMEDADGAHILVGTDLMYNLYWEVGHMNLFTRKFERKEVWVPALFAARSESIAAFRRVYASAMGGGGTGFGSRAASPRSPDA